MEAFNRCARASVPPPFLSYSTLFVSWADKTWARLKTAGYRILITPTMPLLPITLVIRYSGRRLRQLRADPVCRGSRFDSAGDYLVDDLRALRISIPSFVHVSNDCEKIEYTWAVSSLDARCVIVSLFMLRYARSHGRNVDMKSCAGHDESHCRGLEASVTRALDFGQAGNVSWFASRIMRY